MTGTAVAPSRRVSRRFRAAAWVGAILYGLVVLISLVGVASGRNEGIHRVHDLASVITFGIGAVGFASQLRERWRRVALAQLAVITALVLTVIYGAMPTDQADPPYTAGHLAFLAMVAALVLGPAAAMVALHPDRERILRWPGVRSASLLALTALAFVATVPYAATQITEQMTAPAGDAHAIEFHYASMAVLVVALTLAGALAALRTDGRRIVGRLVAVGAVVIGLACVALPDGVSSLGTTGGAITGAAGAAFGVLVQREGEA